MTILRLFKTIFIATLTIAAPVLASQPDETADPATSDDAYVVTSRSGPVSATVRLSPKEPKLGDSLTLELSVVAQPDVDVEMPAFGEALGRFAILDYAPKSRINDDGSQTYEQRYRLDPPMSGPQTIPPLRIQFTDRREDADLAKNEDNMVEMLTEKITLTVASVLDDTDVSGQLKPPREKLSKRISAKKDMELLLVIIALFIAALIWAFVRYRKGKQTKARISAFDVAWKRLLKLEQQGLPEDAQVDQWYVNLSDIIRNYIEDRYGLKAPELTTEEFIRLAGLSAMISSKHRPLLKGFLERCDRVKFAAYIPGEQESADAIASAKRFLEETRLKSQLDADESVS